MKNVSTYIVFPQLWLNVRKTALQKEPAALEVHQKNTLLELHDIDCMVDLPPRFDNGITHFAVVRTRRENEFIDTNFVTS